MGEDIFRKKSLDKLKSPEDLNDYIRVANPGVWMLLTAMIILLVGAVLWGIFGRLETTVPARAYVHGGSAVCYVGKENIAQVEEGMTVTAGDVRGNILSVDISAGTADAKIDTADGEYEVQIVVESVSPMSFVFN